jgi:hypothetical protein
MKSFKTYISELYTIGHTRWYDANAKRVKQNVKDRVPELKSRKQWKTGRQDGDHGGAAYKTTADATKGAHIMKKEFPGRKYSVYKLKGDFDKDTYHSKETGMNHVKRDTEITGKVAHNVTEDNFND